MKVIVGLGNPGREYVQTRHNIGFLVMDSMADLWKLSFRKSRFESVVAEGKGEGQNIILVKPLTFMNLSGEAVGSLIRYFKVDFQDILVVHDDLDFPLGRLKFQEGGSSGGHKGINSLIEHLGSFFFKRLRVGIGRPEGSRDVVDFVLQPFQKKEKPLLKEVVGLACEGLQAWCHHDFNWVMNRFNSWNQK